jgi:hypothetical protein
MRNSSLGDYKFPKLKGVPAMARTTGLVHVVSTRNDVGDNHVRYILEIWCRPGSPADKNAADLVEILKADLVGKGVPIHWKGIPEPIQVKLTPEQAAQLGIEPGVEVTKEELVKRGLWPLPGTPALDQAEKDALTKPGLDAGRQEGG